ncbi:MAG TPA: amidohydrolase [Planctomycetota bacterium]
MRSSIRVLPVLVLGILACGAARAQSGGASGAWVQEQLPRLVSFYTELHAAPELSFHEKRTASRLAGVLRDAGFAVTEGVGGTGVVGVLENGPGPRLLLRTDTDALPIVEETGLPYASAVRVRDDEGREVGVMHACGHDLHMSVWSGTARYLASHCEQWSGTLVCIAQPAEERGAGARAMLEDGLFERFGKPDFCLGLHADPFAAAGTIRYTEGFALANVDSVDVLVRGRGGHGSTPQDTDDPVALAARIVVGLQTIVSRELDPQEPGVVTVGSIHGGTKHNIIPDQVELQLTVRSYSDETRALLLDGIARVARHEALAAGFPEALVPVVHVREEEHTPATYNDPAFVVRINGAIGAAIGAGNLLPRRAVMGGEDFGRYGKAAGCPSYMFWLGSVPKERIDASELPGAAALPGMHTAKYAPVPAPTLRTGVAAMTAAALEVLRR